MKTVKVYLEIELDVEAEYYPAKPEKISGPPEDCYPAEPEEINYYIKPKTQYESWELLVEAVALNDETIRDQIRDHFIAEKERQEDAKAEWVYENKRWAENE